MSAVHAEGAEAALLSSCVRFENFSRFQLARTSITLLSIFSLMHNAQPRRARGDVEVRVARSAVHGAKGINTRPNAQCIIAATLDFALHMGDYLEEWLQSLQR